MQAVAAEISGYAGKFRSHPVGTRSCAIRRRASIEREYIKRLELGYRGPGDVLARRLAKSAKGSFPDVRRRIARERVPTAAPSANVPDLLPSR